MKIGKPCYLCYDKQNRLVTRGWRLVTIFFFFLSFSLSFFSFSSFSFYLFYLFYLFFSLLCLLSLLSFLSLFPVYEFFEIVYIYMSIWYVDSLGSWKTTYMYIIQCIWNLSFHNHTGCCPIRTRKYSSLTFIPWNLRQKWY